MKLREKEGIVSLSYFFSKNKKVTKILEAE